MKKIVGASEFHKIKEKSLQTKHKSGPVTSRQKIYHPKKPRRTDNPPTKQNTRKIGSKIGPVYS